MCLNIQLCTVNALLRHLFFDSLRGCMKYFRCDCTCLKLYHPVAVWTVNVWIQINVAIVRVKWVKGSHYILDTLHLNEFLGRNRMWNVKNATPSDFEERRRAVFVFGSVGLWLHCDMIKKGFKWHQRWSTFFDTVRDKLAKDQFWSSPHGAHELHQSWLSSYISTTWDATLSPLCEAVCTLNKKSDNNLRNAITLMERLPYRHTALCCPALQGFPPTPPCQKSCYLDLIKVHVVRVQNQDKKNP